MWVHVSVHLCICICVCMHVSARVSVCMCACICVCVCVHVFVCLCMSVYMCVCACETYQFISIFLYCTPLFKVCSIINSLILHKLWYSIQSSLLWCYWIFIELMYKAWYQKSTVKVSHFEWVIMEVWHWKNTTKPNQIQWKQIVIP